MDSFVFTRHSSDCKFKRDRFCNRCNCPKWVEGRFNHERFRKSASTRVWDEAEQFREKLEGALSRGLPLDGLHPDSITVPAAPTLPLPISAPQSQSTATASVPIPPRSAAAHPEVNAPSASQGGTHPAVRQKARATVQKAVDAYMTDARSRGLKSDTIKKLERIFEKQFLPWTRVQGLEYLDEVDLDALLAFRSTWTEGAIVKAKKQDRVIGFFWDCFRRNYITQNPALSLSKIKTTPVPTDYFPRDEFDRIIAATEAYGDARGGFIPIDDTRTRLRTLTLLMRWSGLRIRDAVTLERHRLHGDSLLLYQAKTGQAVYVPLPAHVVDALVNIPDGPRPNPRYFFWSGNLLRRNVTYHLTVSDTVDRDGPDTPLDDGKLAVTIECSECGFLKIGPAIAALEEEAEGLGAAFYWTLTYALYRVMRIYNHDDALQYEERMREYAKDDEANPGEYEFPEVEKALPECIRKTLTYDGGHRAFTLKARCLLQGHRNGRYRTWIERLRRIQVLARIPLPADAYFREEGGYDTIPLPSLLVAFKEHDAVIACFDEEGQYMLEGSAEPALGVVFSPQKPEEVHRAVRVVGRFVALNYELFQLVELIAEDWEKRHGGACVDRAEPSLRVA